MNLHWVYDQLIKKAPLTDDAVKELRRIITMLEVDDKLFFYSFSSHLYPFITHSCSPAQLTLINHLAEFKGNILNKAYEKASEWPHSRMMSRESLDISLEYDLEAIRRIQVGLKVNKVNSCQLAFALTLFNLTRVEAPVTNYCLTDHELRRVLEFEYTSGTHFWEKNGVSLEKLFELSKALLTHGINDYNFDKTDPNDNFRLSVKFAGGHLKVQVLENWRHQPVAEDRDKQPNFGGQLFIPNNTIFLQEEVEEFEYYLNKKDIKEIELQKFFGRTPKFLSLLGGGYDRVARELTLSPQILLSDSERTDFRPDFLLKRMGVNYWDILEMKLPTRRLITGSRYRDFSSEVHKAVTQLKAYNRFFSDNSNLKWFRNNYGYNVSYPHLYLLIGRDDSFNSEEEKSRFTWSESVRVLTYDDLHRIAKHNMLSIK
jgi:hypothetical protein